MEVIDACGLTVMIDSQPVRHGHQWDTQMPPGAWFGSVLEGRVMVRTSAIGEGTLGPGATTRFSTRAPVATSHLAMASGVISAVFVRIAPEDMEHVLGEEALRILDGQPMPAGFRRDLPCAIAWQMRGCTLSGPARRFYLAGKALEMMAEAFTPGDSAARAPARAWSPRDVECFHAARGILVAELAAPPTVSALARRVGTNARKLSEGFADLFGTTVYAFVKARRLEEAKRMFEAGETSVSRVALGLGYQPAHFATEFKRRFGTSPSTLVGKHKNGTS